MESLMNFMQIYEFSKKKSLSKNGVTYEFHANPPIFKKSKNGLKSPKSIKYLSSYLTNI